MWKTWDKKIRFEIVRKKCGRLFVCSDTVNLQEDESLIVKGSWGKDDLGLSLFILSRSTKKYQKTFYGTDNIDNHNGFKVAET